MPTEPVSGTVTLNGAPVEGAVVAFSPQSADGHAAFGKTDAAGNYTLTTQQADDGAMVGSYAVTVTKSTQPAAAGGAPADFDPDSEADVDAAYQSYEDSKKSGGESEEPKDLLPAKYKDAATSELTAEVTAGGGTFTFDLKE